jgi:hypothetical protein
MGHFPVVLCPSAMTLVGTSPLSSLSSADVQGNLFILRQGFIQHLAAHKRRDNPLIGNLFSLHD